MTRQQKIRAFWERNNSKRFELYTEYLGYIPFESITDDDLSYIYDAYRYSLKERILQPLLNKIKEKDACIVELFNILMLNSNESNKSLIEDFYKKHKKILGVTLNPIKNISK